MIGRLHPAQCFLLFLAFCQLISLLKHLQQCSAGVLFKIMSKHSSMCGPLVPAAAAVKLAVVVWIAVIAKVESMPAQLLHLHHSVQNPSVKKVEKSQTLLEWRPAKTFDLFLRMMACSAHLLASGAWTSSFHLRRWFWFDA